MLKKKKTNDGNKKNAGVVFGKILRVIYNIFIKYTGLWLVCISSIIGLSIWISTKNNPFTLNFYSNEQTLFMLFFLLTVLIAITISLKKLVLDPIKNVIKGFKKEDKKVLEEGKSPSDTPIINKSNEIVKNTKPERKKWIKWTKKKGTVQTIAPPPQTMPAQAEIAKNVPPVYPSQQYYPSAPPPYQAVQNPYPHFSNTPWQGVPYTTPREEPKIYFSKLEANTLIHEYSDRFEVYKLIDGKAVRDRIEFKN